MFKRVVLGFVFWSFSFSLFGQNLSPFDFGFKEAQTDEQRYEVLLRTHKVAKKRNCGVSYEGLPDFTITITSKTKSIPLSNYTDFAGIKIRVVNNSQTITLFTLAQPFDTVYASVNQIKRGNFRKVKELKSGLKILVIEDKTPWVENRRGYSYGAQRKDVLLLHNGRGENQTIYPYNDGISKPIFKYCKATPEQKVVKNLVVERDPRSSFVTHLIRVNGYNNLLLKDIRINTPEADLVTDRVITIQNSTNITLEHVLINGTYSKKDKSGYGISMNNVWNVRFLDLKGLGNWGIFGTNNTNYVTFDDCDINRFDIHCYGRDIYFRNTVFRDLYNQFSSLYGTLRFDDCIFLDFVPVLFESTYSAYSFFKLELANCKLYASKERPYLIQAGNPSLIAEKPRKEFEYVNWPDLSIQNLKVILPNGVSSLYLFNIGGKEKAPIYGISKISIKELFISNGEEPVGVKLSNKQVDFEKRLKIRVTHSSVSSVTVAE